MTAAPALPATRPTGAAVAVLSLGIFMSSLDLFIVNLAFPAIGREYPQTSTTGLSWVLNAYTIVFAALLVPAGRYADRWGRRRMFGAGLVVFSVSSALCALAPGVGWLVAARVLQAVGAAAIAPASLSLLLAIVPPAGQARAIGTWSAVGGMAAALGPVIGGPLVEISWRWVFWVNVPVGLVAVLLAPRLLPESRDGEPGPRPDLLGALLLAATVGVACWAVLQGSAWGWASPRVLGLLGAAALGLAGFVRRCTRHPVPVIELALLRVRSFRWSLVASVLFYAGFGAFVLNLVEFLTQVWGYSPVLAGLAIAPGPLTVLPFARVVAPRLSVLVGGPSRVAVLGCALLTAGQTLWLLTLPLEPAYLTRLFVPQLLGGAGVGLVIPSLLRAGTASLPRARFGTGSGIINTMRQLGIVLGVAGLIAVLTRRGVSDPLTVFRGGILLGVACFAVAAVASLAIGPLAPTPPST